jgi:hypothetical protein
MINAPRAHLWLEGAEAGAGAMLAACRLAGLSALVFDYAVGGAGRQLAGSGADRPTDTL